MNKENSVQKYLEGMLGRQFTADEQKVFEIAYRMGQQHEFDRWADNLNSK